MKAGERLRTFLSNQKILWRRRLRCRRSGPPLSIQLEITNRCNFRCVMCPAHGAQPSPRPQGNMSWPLFERFCEELRGLAPCFVIPQGAGESLLHPDLVAMITRLKSIPGISVGFNTNGAKLSPELARELLRSGLDDLGFSIDANAAESFRDITGCDEFERVFENFSYWRELALKKGAHRPRLRVLMVDTGIPASAVQNYLQRWLPLVDEVVLQAERVGAGRTIKNPYRREPKRLPCMHLWNTVFIQWDGDLVMCCEDWNSEYVMGNIQEQGFLSWWSGDQLRSMRAAHLLGQFDRIPLCAACESWVDRPVRVQRLGGVKIISDALVKRFVRTGIMHPATLQQLVATDDNYELP